MKNKMLKKLSLSSPIKFDAAFSIMKKQEVASEDGDGEIKHIVEGYAIVAKNVDEQFDMIDSSALKRAVGYLKSYKTVLFNHDPNRPVGKILDAKVTDDKIWVQVQISKQEEDLWSKIVEDIINSFSLSGEIDDFEFIFDEKLKTQVRVIKSFRVHEISLVSIPANPEAKTLIAYITKSLDQAGYDTKSYQEDIIKKNKLKKELEILNIAMEVTKAMDWEEKLQQAIKSIGEISAKIEDDGVQDSLKNIQKLLTDVISDVSKECQNPDEAKSLIELKSIVSDLEKKLIGNEALHQTTSTKIEDVEKKLASVDEVLVSLTEVIKELLPEGDSKGDGEADLEKGRKALEAAGLDPNLIGASS